MATETGGQGHGEIKQCLSCRYVSSSEVMWYFLEYKIHGESNPVYRLDLHLPREQHMYYQEGQQI